MSAPASWFAAIRSRAARPGARQDTAAPLPDGEVLLNEHTLDRLRRLSPDVGVHKVECIDVAQPSDCQLWRH